MKSKVLTVILSVAVVASIFCNVKQYNEGKQLELAIAETSEACMAQEQHNSELESQIADAQAKLESVKSEIDALGVQIETATAEKESLQNEYVELQAKVDQKHKEEEEAAKKAAEVAKTTTSVKTSTPVEDSYELTEEQNEAALQYAAEQLGATIIYVDNNAPISDGIESGHQLR